MCVLPYFYFTLHRVCSPLRASALSSHVGAAHLFARTCTRMPLACEESAVLRHHSRQPDIGDACAAKQFFQPRIIKAVRLFFSQHHGATQRTGNSAQDIRARAARAQEGRIRRGNILYTHHHPAFLISLPDSADDFSRGLFGTFERPGAAGEIVILNIDDYQDVCVSLLRV